MVELVDVVDVVVVVVAVDNEEEEEEACPFLCFLNPSNLGLDDPIHDRGDLDHGYPGNPDLDPCIPDPALDNPDLGNHDHDRDLSQDIDATSS